MTSVLFPVAWGLVGAAAGWGLRWGSVRLARLEGLTPGAKRWQVYGPPILAAVLFVVFAFELEVGHLLTLAERSVFILVLVQVIFFDLEHRLILDRIIFPAMILAVLVSLLEQPWWAGIATGLGTGVLFLFLSIAGSTLLRAEVLGFGDVKLAAFMGFLLGWPAIVDAVFLGVLVGAIAAIAVGVWHRSLKATFAYGPYLAIGALVMLYQAH
ncbi:MAG TPA: A24 family peptidase [Candidatus Dormibacteraeota bacterium]|nr:A24 family peptidase [Candidatus Dormibacteraeota bacterium]